MHPSSKCCCSVNSREGVFQVTFGKAHDTKSRAGRDYLVLQNHQVVQTGLSLASLPGHQSSFIPEQPRTRCGDAQPTTHLLAISFSPRSTRLGSRNTLRLIPKLCPSMRTRKALDELQENPAANNAFCNTSWVNYLCLSNRSASPHLSRTSMCFTLQEFPQIFRPLSFPVASDVPHI